MARFFILFYVFSGLNSSCQDTLKTEVVLDSIGNEVFLLTDAQKQPIKYWSSVFTPVCVDGSCYPININLYWDLAGNYLNYNLEKNVILTKIEHLPFTDFDYGLLHRMIQKEPSALANFSIYELTLPTTQPAVDGITGATRPELAGSFVPEALFTTYTLWHLVRKPTKLLFKLTKSNYFKEEWVSYFLEHQELGCQKAIIQYLLKAKTGEERVDTFIELIMKYDGVFPIDGLQVIPINERQSAYDKAQFKEVYVSTENEQLKLELLKEWLEIGVSEELLISITNELGESALCFTTELLIIDQFNAWPDSEYDLFYDKIQAQKNIMRREKMLQVLTKRFDSYPKKFRRKLN